MLRRARALTTGRCRGSASRPRPGPRCRAHMSGPARGRRAGAGPRARSLRSRPGGWRGWGGGGEGVAEQALVGLGVLARRLLEEDLEVRRLERLLAGLLGEEPHARARG